MEKKEKKQITIRIDTELRNEVLKALEAGAFPEGTDSITDVIERGLHLATNESRHGLSTWAKQVRFMANNMTTDQQRLTRGLLVAMAEPLIDPPHPRTVLQEKTWELIQWFLTYCNTLPEASACIEYYGHYGKKRTK